MTDKRCELHKALGFYYDPCCPFCPEHPELDHAQRHGYEPVTETAILEDGFYWVRIEELYGWCVAQKVRDAFYLTFDEDVWRLSDFDEIDPLPIKREGVGNV